MAEILRYVDPNSTVGGTGLSNALTGTDRAYVSLNAWEAAEQQDLTDGGGDTARVVCSSDDAGVTHAADTGDVIIDGWTTSATCFITIEAASSHGGKWNNSIYRLIASSSGHVVHLVEAYIRVTGLQINNTYDASAIGYGIGKNGDFADNNNDLRISNCIIYATIGTYRHRTIFFYGDRINAKIWNNIIYDGDIGISMHSFTAGSYGCYNNTVYNCTTGIFRDSNTSPVLKNNLIVNCTTNINGTYAAGTDYNATDDASLGYTVTGGGNAHDVLNATAVFVNAAVADFHLAAGDSAIDAGVSDPGSGLFSDDIDGVTRTGTWDIGADEYAPAGSAHPYTGAQGVGAISRSVQTVLAKGKSPTSSGVFARSAATEKARGKIPTVGGGYSLNASTVKARGRIPVIGGAKAFSAESIYSRAALYLYAGGASKAYSAESVKARGRAPAVGGAQAYSAGTIKARGKVPVIGGGFSFNAATVKARGRVPTVGGSMSFSADAVYENATLYLYTAGGDQVYGAASEYSKTAGAAGTAFAYVGQGVIVFSDGSEHAIGRVYERGGAFHFAGGAVYSLSADLPSAYLYTGAGVYSFQSATERARGKVYDGAGAYSFQSGVVRIIGRVRFTSQEAVFVRSGGAEVSVEHSTERPELETKPLARSASHEALPTRPPGQDGFYTEPGQDGFYDEYPVDGFYADIGYFKEFKPFHRGASREAAPGRPAGQDGFYTEPGQDGFYDEYPAQGFYADIGYPKEFKPLRRATFTKEGKPS